MKKVKGLRGLSQRSNWLSTLYSNRPQFPPAPIPILIPIKMSSEMFFRLRNSTKIELDSKQLVDRSFFTPQSWIKIQFCVIREMSSELS